MRRLLDFVAVALLIVLVGVGLGWSFLDEGGRRALVWAGGLVLLSQLPLHVVLSKWRDRNDKFVAAMVLGFASRLLLIVFAIIYFVIPERVEPATFLLALGVFLFATLIVEAFMAQKSIRPQGAANA